MFKNQMLSANEYVTPKNDVVFKLIFGSTGNESILKDFLESVLNTRIQSLSLDLATDLLPEFWDGKQTRIDVRATLDDGTQVNVEMQSRSHDYSDERCLQHWSKLYSNNLKKGKQYTQLTKTICIWILNEDIFPEIDSYESHWQINSPEHPEVNRFTDLEFHFFELKKFRKCDKLEPSKKNMWLWFIDHTNEEMVEMGSVTNKEIAKARKQLDKIRANAELMERIRLQEEYEMDYNTDMYCAEQRGIEKGHAEGHAEGEKAKQLEIARSLKRLQIDIEKIAEATGLSTEEIQQL